MKKVMKKEKLVEVESVSKKFSKSLRRSLYYGLLDSFKSSLFNKDSIRLRPSEFWSLRDVSFSIERGETVGLIGSNGSGKTTMLRLISGIFSPTSGRISINGKVGTLIALGAGFHPHLTGRENIYLNAAIVGMTKKEIDQKLQEIVDFSDIGDFIDTPVANYSSGMNVRLGFSIASHVDVDLLLVDEVLAVGDLSFALKCYKKMSEFRKNGGTTVLVSHNMQLIRNVCNKVIWLEKGVLREFGSAHEVCDKYELDQVKDFGFDQENSVIQNDPAVSIKRVVFQTGQGTEVGRDRPLKVGEDLTVSIVVHSERKISKPVAILAILNTEGIVVTENYSCNDMNGEFLRPVRPGRPYVIKIKFSRLQLKSAKYFISLGIAEEEVNGHLVWHEKKHELFVEGSKFFGLFNPLPEWKVEE